MMGIFTRSFDVINIHATKIQYPTSSYASLKSLYSKPQESSMNQCHNCQLRPGCQLLKFRASFRQELCSFPAGSSANPVSQPSPVEMQAVASTLPFSPYLLEFDDLSLN